MCQSVLIYIVLVLNVFKMPLKTVRIKTFYEDDLEDESIVSVNQIENYILTEYKHWFEVSGLRFVIKVEEID